MRTRAVVTKSHDGIGVAFFCHHCHCLLLCYRQGCLFFSGWLSCRHLRLLSSQLCLHRYLCLSTKASLPLVRWRLSSCLRLFAGWLLHHLLSRRLRLASPFVAQPPLASILYSPSLFALAGCNVKSHHTASASQRATVSHIASCDTSASHPSACPLSHCHFCCPVPLSKPRPLQASSNARQTLLVAALPTSTAPSCSALVLRHVCLCNCVLLFSFADEGRVQQNKTAIKS